MIDCQVYSADELHDFARFIQQEKSTILDAINDLYRAMKFVNEQWDDGQNRKFVDEFIPHLKNIDNLSEHLDEHSRFVEKKAVAIDQYNQIRFRY